MNKIKLQQSNVLNNYEKTLLNVFIDNTKTANNNTLSNRLKQLEINKSYPKLFKTMQQIETKLGKEKAIKYLCGYDEFYNLNLLQALKNK